MRSLRPLTVGVVLLGLSLTPLDRSRGATDPQPTTPIITPDTPGAVRDERIAVVAEGVIAVLVEGRAIELVVSVDEGDGFSQLAARFCRPEAESALHAANPELLLPAAGVVPPAARIPWELLREEFRYLATRAIFPADRFVQDAWRHDPSAARAASFGEGLWQIAEWFTGDGENWRQIATANQLVGPDLPAGRAIRVPRSLLLPRYLPPPSRNGPLQYREDRVGAYAEYQLQKGEALYSAVVVRFTGILEPEDVQAAAAEIARRSGIADVTRLPIGHKVKIPLELISPAWLPENDPRRVAASLDAQAVAEVELPAPPSSLAGVHLLLDAGHGGDDIGARNHRIWESDYVYDIACRIQRLLAAQREVTVHMLVEDRQHGCRVFDARKLIANHKEVVMTTPRHENRRGEAVEIGVNLRWVLANAKFRELTEQQRVPAENIVFVSLHADSLHAAVRGGMVYVPGEQHRRGRFGVSSAVARRYREARGVEPVSFTRDQRLRDEAISRRLAAALLDGYRSEQLPIHDNQPIRASIVRGRRNSRAWLPAVLRGNMVPTKVLLETVNINNSLDAKLLEDPAGRERIARAVVAGLKQHYSREGRPAAATRR